MVSEKIHQIRMAMEGDVKALTTLCRQTFSTTYAAYNTEKNMQAYLEDHFTEDILRHELSDPETHVFLSESDHVLTGYLMLRICAPPPEIGHGKFVEIGRFYVDQAFQGRQVGKSLMETGLNWCMENGFDKIWLGVWKQNTKAVSIYEHLGFVISGETTFLLGDDLQVDHIMIKVL